MNSENSSQQQDESAWSFSDLADELRERGVEHASAADLTAQFLRKAGLNHQAFGVRPGPTDPLRGVLAGPLANQIGAALSEGPEPQDGDERPVEVCSECRREVMLPGVPYWSVDVARERAHGSQIEVVEARSILLFCEGCAEHLDFSAVSVPLRPEVDGEPGLVPD